MKDLCNGIAAFTNIEELFLGSCGFSDKDFETIVSMCPLLLLQVQTLDVSCNQRITDYGLGKIAASVGLQSLNVSFCENITNESIIQIAMLCPLLKALNISYCVRISGDCLRMLGNISRRFETLEFNTSTTGVTGTQGQHVDAVVLDDDVVKFVQSNVGLRCLTLSGHYKLTNICALEIAQHCPFLEELILFGPLTDDSFVSIFTKCTRLRELDFKFVVFCDLSFFRLINDGFLPNLQFLKISLINGHGTNTSSTRQLEEFCQKIRPKIFCLVDRTL